MVAKKFSVRGLHAFFTSDDGIAQLLRELIPFPDKKIPSRRTFDRRLKQFIPSVQLYMLTVTEIIIQEFKVGIARLAIDNRMFEAFGAIWQKHYIIPNKLRNVDVSAGWSKSHYRGWVFGHALDTIVTTGKLVFPVLAYARSLRTKANTSLKRFIYLLPSVRKGVVAADSEHEDQELAEIIKTTGRSLHTPSKKCSDKTPKSKTYRRKKVTVEPYFEKFLLAFHARGKLDRRGPQSWPYLVISCFLYQIMVLNNLYEGLANPLRVTHQIQML